MTALERQRLQDERKDEDRRKWSAQEKETEKAYIQAEKAARRAWRKYESARINRLNKQQSDLHDNLKQTKQRWADDFF